MKPLYNHLQRSRIKKRKFLFYKKFMELLMTLAPSDILRLIAPASYLGKPGFKQPESKTALMTINKQRA